MTIRDLGPAREPAQVPDQAPESIRSPWRHRTRDGRVIEVELSSSPILFRGRQARMVLASDVTEKRALQAQLLESLKMESIGRLAGGVAHDFNNLLSVILGYGETLAGRVPPGGPEARRIEEILKAAERAASLTRQLLAFARRQAVQPTPLDLGVVVQDLESMLRRVIDEDVELRVVLQRGLHPVLVDRAQLEQLIMSLALNARDAMPRGGTLTFKTAVLDLGAAEAPRHPGVAPGPWVLLEVSDTGQGMDAETLAHAFEPFFTTKGRDQGAGAGLGLATVYGIVKQAGGHVTAESEPGRGARFRIYLPRLRGEHEGAPVTAEAPAEPGGQQTILLIEDEPALRELLREVLAEAGYRVFAVGDGEAGLAAAREHREALHLLLTDVVMPRMSGREVAARLRLERPGLRVLYMSGYTDNAIFQHGLPEPGATFLQKPIGPETLVRRVRELLGR